MELGASSRVLNGSQRSYLNPRTRFHLLRDLSNSPHHSSNLPFPLSSAIPRRGCGSCEAIGNDSTGNSPVEKVKLHLPCLFYCRFVLNDSHWFEWRQKNWTWIISPNQWFGLSDLVKNGERCAKTCVFWLLRFAFSSRPFSLSKGTGKVATLDWGIW